MLFFCWSEIAALKAPGRIVHVFWNLEVMLIEEDLN